jgi:hypothetical protein
MRLDDFAMARKPETIRPFNEDRKKINMTRGKLLQRPVGESRIRGLLRDDCLA